MANNNNTLYNAALAGFLQGALSGRFINDAVAADYNTLVLAGQAFAQQVDAGIATDVAISTAVGTPTMLAITGGSNAQAAPILAKFQLLKAICSGAMHGRYSLDAVKTDYAGVAAACVAVYTQALTVAVIP